jgi:hypothetical protein
MSHVPILRIVLSAQRSMDAKRPIAMKRAESRRFSDVCS